MSKSTAIMFGLFAFAIIGGPVIFYGLLAMGKAGVFDNALDNFWAIAGIAIGVIVLLWGAMLYFGSLATAAGTNKEQLDG